MINKTRSIISALLPSSPVNQIKKVFNAASHKKVSDHLTKAQRKNIDAWKRQVLVRILQLSTQKAPTNQIHFDDQDSVFCGFTYYLICLLHRNRSSQSLKTNQWLEEDQRSLDPNPRLLWLDKTSAIIIFQIDYCDQIRACLIDLAFISLFPPIIITNWNILLLNVLVYTFRSKFGVSLIIFGRVLSFNLLDRVNNNNN